MTTKLASYHKTTKPQTKSENLKKLVTNMGLQVFITRITQDKSVYGQLYFEKTKTHLYSNKDKKWKNLTVPKNK